MSRDQYAHITDGRKPWWRWVSLRHSPSDLVVEPIARQSLREAASTVESPVWYAPWQRAEAKHRLFKLCDWLDGRLKRPARVERVGPRGWRVEVFDSFAYTVCLDEQSVSSQAIYQRRLEPLDGAFEVGRPLISPNWLTPLLYNLNLIDAPQRDVFFHPAEEEGLADWLKQAAYRLLLRHPVFRQFREQALPRLLRFPRDIFGIALASRRLPVGPILPSWILNTVWRNDRAFGQAARENPQMLPLLLAYVVQLPVGEQLDAGDPVLALKCALRQAGLAEATWRYFARHGSRLFRPAWEAGAASGQPAFEVAVRYLRALEASGLPPPPPPSIARALLHGFNAHRGNAAIIREDFQTSAKPFVLRAGLIEADRKRQASAVEGFAEEFLGVCFWSESLPDVLDANQTKGGWKCFVRRWQEEESVDALLRQDPGLRWETRIEEFELGPLRIVPIESSAALIRESQAMRNCLRVYIEECAARGMEIYSVRDALHSKRLGCVGFRFDRDGPQIFDVKGFANSPPTGAVRQAAFHLLGRLQCAY
ncbi:MAG: PcfJ domain-containing protein [Betaproteobacteria bacterium]|nr:PcfJ domain-containing protein [Betaproteobacteria bacterium]